MEAITLPIYSVEGREIETIKLNPAVFGIEVNKDAVYQVVNAYRANQRQGLASTKTRGEVSGGGRKPWKQKGTGRARVGSTRSPLWRHGGVVFGPHPRDFSVTLPQKIRNLALKSVLSAKVKENNLIVLDEFKVESPKTKLAAKVFDNLKIHPSKKDKFDVLFLMTKLSKEISRPLSNIDFVNIGLAKDANTYEVLAHKKVLITKEGLRQLTERLKS